MRFFYTSRRDANGGKPVRLNICWTCRLLDAHCAALILPTRFLRVAASRAF